MNKVTLTFIGAFIIIVLAVDAYFGWHYGEEGTISWQYARIVHQWPVLAFALGFVMGHLNWQLRKPPGDQ